ncbi:hypothetical protein ACQUY5_28885 [Bacillus cereus]|uniref:hypothetical protein n=1 Tax=Bacillus cereus TaxID=1396 RepID=UPI003D1850DF
MKRKILAVALPLTLALGVGCSNKDVAEGKKTDEVKAEDYKKTDSVTDAESDKKEEKSSLDFIKVVNDEIDKVENKEESIKNKIETKENSNDGGLGQYQSKIEESVKLTTNELDATTPIVQKDFTLKTNKDELKAQYKKVKEQVTKLVEIEPPKGQEHFKEELKDKASIITMYIDQLFDELYTGKEDKAKSTIGDIKDGFKYLSVTVDEIRKAGS